MRWRVLGPLEVRAGQGWTGVDAPKRRAVLAALLAEPGQVVPAARLIDELWEDDPPPAARKLVSGYVLKLRRLLGDPGGQILVTQAPGYRLVADRAEVDAGRFEELVAQGRAALADDDAERAGDLLAAALALWRGPALADVPRGPLAAAEVDRLEEARLAAVELRIEAGLRRGQGTELVPELRRLTTAHPLRERLWHLLIHALAGAGRQAEALAAYEQARQVIAGELGADPGPDLQRLHQRLLAGGQPQPAHSDEGCTGDGRPSMAPSTAVIPRQLPGTVRHFTGREAELRQLSRLLDEPSDTGAVVISAIGGTAGVGKTALAVRWAHQAADRFPDGQLYVNLRGYDPGEPMPASDALAAFLHALGVPGRDIPAGTDERAARYRSLLAGRRMLILLDNAGSVQQVRPLLPGTAACVTVVTSRDSLAGLVARDGARRLDLDLLPAADAQLLLTTLIGDRAAADPTATRALAAQCARLPLALRVAAELAAARPDRPLAGLLAELADRQRLDLLESHGDPATAVRAVFSWSYRSLDAGAARAFRLAGLHPGPDFDHYAAVALTGSIAAAAQHQMDLLERAHLVQSAGPGRYGLHDLLRAYARELATAEDGEDECQAALTRLFDHYLHTTTAATDTLYPAELARRHRAAEPVTPGPPVSSRDDARAWLDAQLATLAAIARHAAAHGWPGHAVELAVTLHRYLDGSGHYPEAVAIHTQARHAAQLTGDQAAEAAILANLGLVHVRQCRYPQAAGHLRQALALSRQTGDLACAARAVGILGIIDYQEGRYQQAASNCRQAMTLFRQIGNQTGEATSLTHLSNILCRQGHYEQATGHLQQALALYRDTGNQSYESYALEILGLVDFRQGRHQQAADHLEQALALSRRTGNQGCHAYTLIHLAEIELHQSHCQQAASNCRQAMTLFRQIGDRAGQAVAFTRLGSIALRQGHLQQASGHFERALTLYRLIGVRSGQAEALNGLGGVRLAAGQPGQARLHYSTALDMADEIGEKDQQARAHNGLGRVAQASGDLAGARHHRQRALTIYTELGAPEADQIRGRPTLDPPPESA